MSGLLAIGCTVTTVPQFEQKRAVDGNPLPQRWQNTGMTNLPYGGQNCPPKPSRRKLPHSSYTYEARAATVPSPPGRESHSHRDGRPAAFKKNRPATLGTWRLPRSERATTHG